MKMSHVMSTDHTKVSRQALHSTYIMIFHPADLKTRFLGRFLLNHLFPLFFWFFFIGFRAYRHLQGSLALKTTGLR